MIQIGPQSTSFGVGLNARSDKTEKKGQIQGRKPAISTPITISKSNTSTSSSTSSVGTPSKREQVQSRSSNLLLTTSISLTRRQSLSESLTDGLSKVKELATEIKNEVNPRRSQALKDEATSIITDLQAEYNKTVEEDPTISKDISLGNLTKPGADANDSSKYTTSLIRGLSSPDSLGLNSIDFSNPDEAISAIDNALYTYSNATTDYGSNQNVLKVTAKNLSEAAQTQGRIEQDEKESEVTDLASKISTLSSELLEQGSPDRIRVLELLADDEDDSSTNSSVKKEADEDTADLKTNTQVV